MYFYPEGSGKAKPGYVLHHKDETLRHENPDRYNEWNPEDLVMMTDKEHKSLHHSGFKYSEESKKKISESQKGRKLSEEQRKKLSESLKGNQNRTGIPHSDETKRKISNSIKGENHPLYGKHHTEETRRKMSEAHRNVSEETRRKMSESNKGHESWNKGKANCFSEESRRKMSEARKRYWINHK